MRPKEYQADFLTEACTEFTLPGAQLEYYAKFMLADVAWATYESLLLTTAWRQERITVYGKTHPTPRLSSWVGDQGADYSYSQLKMKPLPWNQQLSAIKHQVETITKHTYNSVLLNYYRDGQDANGWHSDDEPELGRDPVIASLSLGAVRDFQLRHKENKTQKFSIALAHGSLLVMRGSTQRFWQHQIPRRAHVTGRINLTFRTILSEATE